MRNLEDQMVKENTSATFICGVHPAISTVIWHINGEEVRDRTKYQVSVKGAERSLVLKSVQEKDEGVVTATLADYVTNANLIVEGMSRENYTNAAKYCRQRQTAVTGSFNMWKTKHRKAA